MATINYIHHNAVHHGYVSKWQEWPFSSAINYLKDFGKKGVLEKSEYKNTLVFLVNRTFSQLTI